ncbi:hypothetical protein CEP51_001714 [Fusarium floridanum]|uniref:ubiquitinyl hydrolase 1 n=1 Tax=Fusarium floridanum TaxID=1325733 RepID=A0A428SF03_9HYPO|nr:hypothetical protein CEP51_001714 [Fusarium floridanum]
MASDGGKPEDVSGTSFGYLYHHLFLPPKLPGADDTSQKNDTTLLQFVQRSLKRFLPGHHDQEALKAGVSVLMSLKTSKNPQGYLKDVAVRDILKELSPKAPVAALQITEQNAGVFISRSSDSVCFEVFELSPRNEAVMSIQGRLVRHFPATAVEITAADFESQDFQMVMAKTLAKMSQQTVRETRQVNKKENREKKDNNETPDPMIVTELLVSILRGCGKEVAVEKICKNTRDDVIWKDGKVPWRRSSTWLLVRVALQLSMTRLSATGKNTYKEFMVFLMAQVLQAANEQQKVSSEILQTMSNKVSRRLCKLQRPSDGPWLVTIRDVVSQTSGILQKRWRFIADRAEPPLSMSELCKFKIDDNITFSLKDMETFIRSTTQRKAEVPNPRFRPTSELNSLPQNQLPSVGDWSENYLPFKLLELESWVAENLQTWIDHNMRKADNPVRDLRILIEAYHTKAASYYSGRPEGASRMILTISELWYAADVAATQELPLLADYNPEIPVVLWQALLLGPLQDMERLQRLENYISNRVKVAEKADRPSILGSFGSPGSFAVEFFRNSTRHQQIKYEIEAEAAAKRREKREEFRKAKTEYVKLMQKHAESECDVTTKRDAAGVMYIHPSSCRRCGFESKANALGVFVHEWPLPHDELEAQATVFEMVAPVTFSEWRDLTVHLINDVLLCHPAKTSTPQTTYSLKSYQPLKPWHATKTNYRIHLRSGAKPNAVIHRRALPVGQAAESDICLNSGLMYEYYDETLNSFSCDLALTDDLSKLCTFKLPKRAHVLGQFLRRNWRKPDGQTPNEGIISQFECPEWMPLCEFKALVGMAYGHKIQWMNILTELAMPNIDFNKRETAIFLLQMSLQAGPASSSATRSTHSRPCDELFGRKILQSLSGCVLRMQENWDSYTALWSFTFLTTRLLSLVPKDLSRPFLDLLEQCRETSYSWVRTLLERVEDTSDDVRRRELLETASSIALVCIDSFNVDDGFLHQILASSQQAAILVECSIIVHENLSLKSGDDQIFQDVMLDRWRRTMYRARPIMDEQIASGSSFLSDAVHQRWRYFQPTSSWSLSTGTKCWYQTAMEHLKMHLNILTGELLVNDLPLSRLPADYETHHEYKRIFGNLLHNVMPSTSSGMIFCTTRLLQGYTVHFGRERQDLLLRLENDTSCYDYIPSRVFAGLLPDSFVDEYAHWYNSKTGAVEFCLLSNPFPARSCKWCLEECDGSWKLRGQEGVFMLAPASGLAQCVATIMADLETPLSLHMLYDANRRLLDIRIPRLELGFFLNEGESVIRSRQFRETQVDEDQSLGTLVGLKSKLVLRGNQNPPMRLVLIPEGDVEIKKNNSDVVHNHVTVCVRHGTVRRVQSYQIDDLLGRFVTETKLESKLYLTYLHALTSFCLPDPFIGRRGTEEALDILSSASVRAPMALSPIAYNILNLIAALAPSRHYHPDNSKTMQNVVWSSQLPVSIQDDRFLLITDEISRRSAEVGFLYPNAEPQPGRKLNTDVDLAVRAISRNAAQYVSGFGAEDCHAGDDEIYQSRDNTRSGRAARAATASHQAFHGEQGLMAPVSGGLALSLYKLMAMGKTANHRGAPPKRDMEYDSMWLQRPSSYLSSYWSQLHHAFHDNPQWLNKMELSVWIATIAYSAEHDEQITQALLMMALSPSVAAAQLPLNEARDLSKGYTLQPETLETAAAPHMVKVKHGPEGKSRSRTAKGDGKAADRLKREYGKDKKQAINIFRDKLARQWPCQVPKQPSDHHMEAYIDVVRATKAILAPWRIWWANKNFKEYLERFVAALKEVPLRAASADHPSVAHELPTKPHHKGFMSVSDLFQHDAPDTDKVPESAIHGLVTKARVETVERKELDGIVDFLESQASFQYERNYLNELRQSLSNLKSFSQNNLVEDDVPTALLQDHLAQCESRHKDVYNSLRSAVKPFSKSSKLHSPQDLVEAILSEGGSQPRITPVFFLQQLRNSSWSKLTAAWKSAIIQYGLAVAALQKARRLIRSQNDPVDLLRELENRGHENWSPHDYPEWLLLECESQITIREVQQQIAQQMIRPPGQENAVMQLNMGEGKSSVIVPIVATTLGDGSKLVRIIVAKPQAKQMYQMLSTKLSGLVNRPVYQLPFSRDVQMDISRCTAIHQLLVRCQKEGGILLVQPEHLLSFQLMELELELESRPELAEQMKTTRLFFEDHARDVVDESDENFNVKFELIYTLGQQRSVEDSPDRWTIVQEVLSLVHHFAAEVKEELPQSIDLDERHGHIFPVIRILRRDAEEAIFGRIAGFICETGITGFPIAYQPPVIRNAVRRYITQRKLSVEEVEAVEHSRFWNGKVINHALLLRGLLAGGVLAFALGQKRWRVNYGLDLNREKKTRLAIPYKAKDNPAPRSEFSHPDIVVVLTCLSYYYGGLRDQALFDSLELLTRSDNADSEYQSWVQSCPTMPDAFKHVQGINTKDHTHCVSTVFPYLRYSKAAIDYYLHRMVFPQELKEFPYKLSASGWDLGKKKRHITTGFSGTNDSRYILPLDIRQLNLPEQNHTNALVLENLLCPENGITLMTDEMVGATFHSQYLLETLANMDSRPRVILDVGAQVVDLTNLELARAWLCHYADDENTQAVIFFNDFDEIVVMDKSGKVEELQTSPFADQLDQCLVFLDEAHTRGTDLRLPTNYQAAVTLGAHLTKDRLVQACMRMRKLGRGQSVVFFIPREIEQKIRVLQAKNPSPSADIIVADVICWAITETCTDLRKAVPLWLRQGLRFTEHQARWEGLKIQTDGDSRLEYVKQFMEDEAQSLDRRYRPHRANSDIFSMISRMDPHAATAFESRCVDFGLGELGDSSFNEEQERELSPELEQELQAVRPPQAEPAEHQPAFMSLATTSAAQHLDISAFPSNIVVTRDFAETVDEVLGHVDFSDSFQKPVQWILSVQRNPSILVIVSPYEVQQLLPAIEQSKHVALHLYSPRINVGYKSLDNLDLYIVSGIRLLRQVSRHVIGLLCQFSGQLYLSSFEDYVQLCESLGLAWKPGNNQVMIGPDGFILPDPAEGDMVNTARFSKSPVPFLKALVANDFGRNAVTRE